MTKLKKPRTLKEFRDHPGIADIIRYPGSDTIDGNPMYDILVAEGWHLEDFWGAGGPHSHWANFSGVKELRDEMLPYLKKTCTPACRLES